jgi:hypothetical protein
LRLRRKTCGKPTESYFKLVATDAQFDAIDKVP